MDKRPWIVMRSRNDIGVLAATLDALARQDQPHRLLVFDNASSDGTAALAASRADRFVSVPESAYVPGRVLNRGMELTDGDVVVFLNSDCTPVDGSWLRQLLAPFADPSVTAAFGRQMPRPGCPPLEAKDLHETYGIGNRQARWRHCFSMASSAVRRSAWHPCRFDETLSHSEDIEWSWRIVKRGGGIRFAPASRVLHSHAYSLSRMYTRHYGEGAAEARIFRWSRWESSLLRYSLLPYARKVLSDLYYFASAGSLTGVLHAPVYRLAQFAGRRAGFTAARRRAGAQA